MKRNTNRILVGIGLGCFALCSLIGWVIASLSHASLINNTTFDIRNPQSYGNPLSIGATLGLLCALLFVGLAFIGALVRLGELRHWGWFATLLALLALAAFSTHFEILAAAVILAFALYLFIGPDTMASQRESA
ncbi:MAG TPA: hypothetical protein VF812_19180 [Ktedonobacterales bacterium]